MRRRYFLNYKYITFLLLFSLILFNTPSLYPQQNKKIETLISNLKSEKEISKRISILNSILWESRYVQPENGIKFGKEALLLETESGDNKEKPKTLNLIGLCYLRLHKHNTAMSYFTQALESAKKLDQVMQIAYSHNNIGNTYQIISQYDKASVHIYKAMNKFIKLENKKGIAHTLAILAVLEINLEKYDKALEHLQKALIIRKEMKSKSGQLRIHIEIAEVYYLKKQYDLSLKKYFYLKPILKKQNNRFQYAVVLSGIATNYYKMKKYFQALTYRQESLAINIEIDASNNIIRNYIGIGKIYTKLKKFDQALEYINKGINLSIKVNLNDHELDSLESLIELHNERFEYKKAYVQYKKFIALKDNIFNKKTSKQIEILRIQYDFENKEREINFLKNKSQIKELERDFLIVSLIMGFIILIVLTFRFSQTVKTNRILKQQKAELENAYTNLMEMNKKVIELEKKNLTMAMAITTNHEIKQPLTVIQGYFELLMKKLNKKDFSNDEKSYIIKINNSIERIITILDKYRESDGFSIDQYDTDKKMIIFNEKPIIKKKIDLKIKK